MNDSTWIRVNVVLRVMIILILLAVGSSIIYFKYGYENPDDTKMERELGEGVLQKVTCREALYYYAENEWGLVTNSTPTIPFPNYSFGAK